jgi:hypothetical protein
MHPYSPVTSENNSSLSLNLGSLNNLHLAIPASPGSPCSSSGRSSTTGSRVRQPVVNVGSFSRETGPSIVDLQEFVASATSNWVGDTMIRRFDLGNGDFINCVLWNGSHFITACDIVKVIAYRMFLDGVSGIHLRRVEEGVLNDLRQLKTNVDAVLEEPKSDFLHILQANNCTKTLKKQKVYFWHRVPFERLYNEAMDRYGKRLAAGGMTPVDFDLNIG